MNYTPGQSLLFMTALFVHAVDALSDLASPDMQQPASLDTTEVVTGSVVPSVTTQSSFICTQCSGLRQRCDRLKRFNVRLRARLKAALRKIHTLSKRNVAVNAAVGKFLRRDQMNALRRRSKCGVKWSTATIKEWTCIALYMWS